MNKKPGAFWTISEVADELELPQHVLRFWETRFPQIKPLKSGGGRRYYRPEDVSLIQGIRCLLYDEGYTIKGVQKILKERGVQAVQDCAFDEENLEEENFDEVDDTVEEYVSGSETVSDDYDFYESPVIHQKAEQKFYGLQNTSQSTIVEFTENIAPENEAVATKQGVNIQEQLSLFQKKPEDKIQFYQEKTPQKSQISDLSETAHLGDQQLESLLHIRNDLKECKRLLQILQPQPIDVES